MASHPLRSSHYIKNANSFTALERLARLSRIQCSVSADASKALRWLDQVTSWTEHKIAGRVKLQGPEDQYQAWEDVEKYLLPETPLTSSNGPQRVDRLSKMLDRGLDLNGQVQKAHSPNTSPTSTASSMSGAAEDETSSTLSAHGITPQIRPLLNYTVWCTQQGVGDGRGKEKFILVTNDPVIQKQASKFGVRTKLLSQLQTVLGRKAPIMSSMEMVDLKPSDGWDDPLAPANEQGEEDDVDDEVLFHPSPRPKSSPGDKTTAEVMDPNHFGRSPKLQPQGTTSAERGNGRGNRSTPRGKNTNNRSRGGHRGGSSNASPPIGPSGQRGSARGRGNNSVSPRGRTAAVPKQIDPDSFVRPAHMSRRGRGSIHKLWDPASSG